MGAPNEIIDLMNRFYEQQESYRAPTYNETQLVYQLYGLTDDEIRIVEEATAR